ncbi:MAG: hypothetical protein JL50_02815 [Peptococcaceae bacterium BICA1-7]|nr:MAG: hypothetical protein JL50_02815 [Peptococcaceae bacterium BICA1-7]HBV97805.1 hypothetical protein [Desulfotomaculum sp.]
MTDTEKRIYGAAYKNTRKNEEYTRRADKIIELGRKIMKQLGPHRLLFLEYERQIGLSESLYLENAYLAGLEDGQDLSRKSVPQLSPKRQGTHFSVKSKSVSIS